MTQVATMSVRFAAEIADFEKNVSKAEKTFLRSAKSMIDMGKSLSLELTAPFLAISGVMAKSAADAEASMTRFTRMFGPATDQMAAFAKEMEKVIPVTDEDMKGLLATTQQFISQLGLAPQAALEMTKSLTKLAGDIAAFRGVDITQVMDELEHGMAGRTQGLITLGIAINKTEVKEKAYQMGLAVTGGELSVAAQSEATLALVREKTTNITGQAAAMAGNAANATKFLHQATVEMAVEWGNVLLPFATKLVHGLTDIAHWMATTADSTKLLVLGVGGLAAVGGPALLVIGSMIKSLTELEKVVRRITGAEGLMALATGGAVIVAVLAGLAAIGAAFYASGADARAAQSQIDSYKQSLQGLSAVQTGQALLGANARLLDATGKLNTMTPSSIPDWLRNGLGMAPNPYNSQARLVGTLAQQQADAQRAYNATMQGILFPGAAGATGKTGGRGGKVTAGATDPVTAMISQSTTLLGLQKDVAAGGDPLLELNNRIIESFAALTVMLHNTADQYGAVALSLRGAASAAGIAIQANAKALIGVTGGIGAPTSGITIPIKLAGVPLQGKNIDIPHLPGVESKLDTLGGVFKDAIASQAQFIAQSLTTVLGVRNANAGGAIGSVIGGAVGAGVAGHLVGNIAGKAVARTLGAALGGTVGSVVPVVGTVIGSIAGGLIGNALGSLFGGHKNAANNSATALNSLATAAQKVTAALSNVPTGFKIALDRYRVSDPSAIPFGAQLPGGYGPAGNGVTITGDVHVYGVQDIKGLYTQITAYARGQGVRGGTTQWQLASSPAGI